MPDYTQEGRPIAIDTPLGQDVLLLTGFSGAEHVSRLFEFSLELASEKGDIAPADIVGHRVTFMVRLTEDEPRYFNGFVSHFAYVGRDDRLNYYRARVVPWLWFLTRSTDCRVFQDMPVKEIATTIFQELGFSDFEDSTTGANSTVEYCVQYRETDFNFVSRLFESQGIFYFFRHEEGKHTLIMADNKDVHLPCTEQTIAYTGESEGAIKSWEHCYEYRSGKYTQTDYDFEHPSASLKTSESTVVDLDDIDKFELYDYPGGYKAKSDGDAIAKIRMQEDESAYNVVGGSGTCKDFCAGGKFTIEDHIITVEQNKSYVLTSVRHHATIGGAYITGSDAGAIVYSNSFDCIPASVVYRPERLTPKAVVRGVQPAVVVGPSGEEIYTDKYGRVKIQFFWDREGKKDDRSSCWVRVSQPLAGNNWGAIFLPRIGQEVLIDFLEGDPDHPIIIGRVYNAQQMPPYALPANATQSGFKTRSSKGGGEANFNELRFEDKKGSEDIYFHAEKDFHRVVEHDDDLKVMHDQTIEIDHDQTVQIRNDQNLKVSNNQTVQVQNDRSVSIEMGNDALKIKMGNQTTKLDLGKSETEAMQSIELKVGQSSIKIDQMGVTISGMMVKIEGQIQTEVKGMMIQVSADAMLQAKGAITMIG
jgi:type VI secretion system secreted protein VgrG